MEITGNESLNLSTRISKNLANFLVGLESSFFFICDLTLKYRKYFDIWLLIVHFQEGVVATGMEYVPYDDVVKYSHQIVNDYSKLI